VPSANYSNSSILNSSDMIHKEQKLFLRDLNLSGGISPSHLNIEPKPCSQKLILDEQSFKNFGMVEN
jgi:hypothetical protein